MRHNHVIIGIVVAAYALQPHSNRPEIRRLPKYFADWHVLFADFYYCDRLESVKVCRMEKRKMHDD